MTQRSIIPDGGLTSRGRLPIRQVGGGTLRRGRPAGGGSLLRRRITAFFAAWLIGLAVVGTGGGAQGTPPIAASVPPPTSELAPRKRAWEESVGGRGLA